MSIPNMAGEDLARSLVLIRPDIPIIICTGFSERIDRESASKVGIKGILLKRVVKSDLAQMGRTVIDARES